MAWGDRFAIFGMFGMDRPSRIQEGWQFAPMCPDMQGDQNGCAKSPWQPGRQKTQGINSSGRSANDDDRGTCHDNLRGGLIAGLNINAVDRLKFERPVSA
jgi:hypothetical protein